MIGYALRRLVWGVLLILIMTWASFILFFVITLGLIAASVLIVRRVRDYELIILGLVVAAAAMHFSSWSAPVNLQDTPGTHAEVNTVFNDGCPIQSPDEMNMPLPELVKRLANIPGYKKWFETVFPSEGVSSASMQARRLVK